jgi:hypothetical protein
MGESQNGEQRGDERDGECAIQGDLVRDWIGADGGGRGGPSISAERAATPDRVFGN